MSGKSIRYVVASFLVAAFLHAVVGVLNYLVDPLWFFGGNKLQARNFPFDERTARLAHFVTSDRDFDCYIFGASRVAMMNVRNFRGYSCFMVSFANATPRELLAYASYMKALAKRKPRLIIVGVDDFGFVDLPETFEMPAALLEHRTPYFWQYYFSTDVTLWSLKTLLDISPKPRYYAKDLSGAIRDDAKDLPILRVDMEPGAKLHMSLTTVADYADFRKLFPDARLVAYATPVSAAMISTYAESGALQTYLVALHEIASYFDEMYDFSIPSEITNDLTLTYDGSHYEPRVSDQIAAAIQSHEPAFGIVLSGKTLDEVQELYAQRLAHYSGSDL